MKFVDAFLTGLASARPSAASLGNGVFYYATDSGVFSRTVSGSWVTYFTITGGGGSAWSVVGSWTFSVNVTTVQFTGLAGLQELYLVGAGVTKDQARVFNLRFSLDNGSTWKSTTSDYIALGTAGQETGVDKMDLTSTTTTAARAFQMRLTAIDLAGAAPANNPLIPQAYNLVHATAINALQVLLNGAGNFTGGTITLYGR